MVSGGQTAGHLHGLPADAPPPDPATRAEVGGDGGARRQRGRHRESRSDPALILRLLQEAGPYRRHVTAIFLLSLLAAPLALLTPLPLKMAVDSGIGSDPLPDFVQALLPGLVNASPGAVLAFSALMLLVVALLTQLQSVCTAVLQTYTGERLLLTFRSRIFQHLQLLSLSYHDRTGTADSLYRIQYDAMALQYVAVDGLVSLVTAVVTVASMIYVTARIDVGLALIALSVVPPLLLTSWRFRARLRSRSRQVKQLESGALSVVQEVLTGLRVVKAFGQEDREQERFVGRSREGVSARLRLALAEGAYGVLVGVIVAAGSAGVLLVGGQLVRTGTVTLGELLAVMSYLTQLYAPVKTAAKRAGTLQGQLASADRVFDLLDQTPAILERPGARPLRRAAGAVTFTEVTFGYEPLRPVLHSVSFHVPAGARVGVAGRTGAGKSTLMSLLTRLVDPGRGRILLDGEDLRDYRVADLRNQFGVVLQDPVLFSTTIGDNIAYARPDASQHEVEAAAVAANAHDFIMALPDGYATQVGERGLSLSGGERQRISLARAFLKDAPILILDEPTSAVDVGTERLILDAVERLAAGRTSFMISHRPGSLDSCDLVVTIDEGRATAVAGATARFPELEHGLRS
jgi:ATP-binding cassette subfamily B protein